MKKIPIIIFVFSFSKIYAQELFVFTEPASNMAARSIGIRMNNYLMKEKATNRHNYHLLPELMMGISRKIMLHGEMFLSNRNDKFVAEGGSIYLKYRLLSIDDVHSHFRLAVLARYSYNNSDVHQQAIDFFGHNAGYEGGLVATKLAHKVAVSAGASIMHATDNGKEKFAYSNKERDALYYTLSVGKLMLPKEYTNYNQTNLNLMLELIGQANLGSNRTYLDLAPSIQFIFGSRARLDLGYRFALADELQRTSPNGFAAKVEYNFFNVL